jgi:hypothetical protein
MRSASPDSSHEPSPPPPTAINGLPVFFTALAEEDLDQMVKAVLRILHAAQD